MLSPLKKLAGTAAAIALCATPAMATAATSAQRTVSPLVAVSLFGTQGSAQAVCAQGASTAATAGAAAAAQAQAGCVLPATDAPPPPVGQAMPPPAPVGDYGINWLLAGLGALALIGGLSTLFDDDDDDDDFVVSPG